MARADLERDDYILDNNRSTWVRQQPPVGVVVLLAPDTADVRWPNGRTTTIPRSRIRPEVEGKALPHIGYTLRKSPRYVGVVEYTDTETLGYYWPWTEEAEAALRSIVETYQRDGIGDYRIQVASEPKLRAMGVATDAVRSELRRANLFDPPVKGWAAFVARATTSTATTVTVLELAQGRDPFAGGRGLGEPRSLNGSPPTAEVPTPEAPAVERHRGRSRAP